MNNITASLSDFTDKLSDITKYMYEYKTYIFAVISAIAILYIIIKIKKKFSPIKLFDNTNGIVSLERSALKELVESVCYNMGSLNRPKVKIQTKSKKLYLDVSIKIESSQKLVDFTSKLQDEIQLAFIQQLGIEKIGKININISDFRGLLKKPLKPYQRPIDNKKNEEESIDDDSMDDFDFIDTTKLEGSNTKADKTKAKDNSELDSEI